MIRISFLLLLVLFSQTAHADDVAWPEELRKMYEQYPSSRMLTDPERLKATMELVNKDAAEKLQKFLAQQPQAYDAAREAALKLAVRPLGTKGTVLLSGASGTGSSAAKVFAEAGFKVEAFESRAIASREVTWGARQELISSMCHYYGADVCKTFQQEIVKPVGGVYKHVSPDMAVTASPLPKILPPSSAGLAGKMTGKNIVGSDSVAAVAVKDLEVLVRNGIAKDPNINLVLGKPSPALQELSPGVFSPVGEKAAPTFVVLAEGAGSKTSKAAGIARDLVSPERLQVAGIVHTDLPGGNAVGATFRLPGSDKTIVTGSLHRAGSGKVWLVTDLDPKLVEPASTFIPKSPEYIAEKARLVDKEYRQIASTVLKVPPAEMAKLKVSGAVGGDLMPFNMQLGVSKQAVKGNMILIGDNVANGHWASGAGGMVGMTAHSDALANYLNDLERRVDPKLAADVLNKRLRGDSLAWVRAGIGKFWPDLPEEEVRKAFDRAMADVQSGKAASVQVALEEKVKQIRVSAPAPVVVRNIAGDSCGSLFNLIR